MAKKRLTGIGIGTPAGSASLSWDYVLSDGECLVLSGGKLPQVRQVRDPIAIGVHPSPPAAFNSRAPKAEIMAERVPAYVPRDIDDELRLRLTVNSFILLVGDSSAGKSRTAYEVVLTMPDHVLIVPQNRDAVAGAIEKTVAARRCVLWLDDLEKYLGTGGLTRTDVARVLAPGKRAHRVIVATLRSAEETRLTAEVSAEAAKWQFRRDAREVLEQAFRFPMPRMLSSEEKLRAEAQTWDPRIADALARSGVYGLAEYLAAGPELLRDWENAWCPNTDPQLPSHPRGAALIAAAIDIRRGGYASPLPRALLEEVHDYYLRQRGGSRLRPEPIAQAWTWAMVARRATTALLEAVDDNHVQVFDYLLDSVQRKGSPDYPPDDILEAAVAVSAPGDAANIADTAYCNGRYELAETASRHAYRNQASTLGPEHPDTLASRLSHAHILRALDRPAEAYAEHQAIADIAGRVSSPEHPLALEGRTGRAFALIRLGQFAEAEEELRAVCEISAHAHGPAHDLTLTSRHLRAIALTELGRHAEAEAENRFMLDSRTQEYGPDDSRTLHTRTNLAWTMYRAGRFDEAEQEAHTVLEICNRTFGSEHPQTLHNRALHAEILRNQSRPDQAEAEYHAIMNIAQGALGPEHPTTLRGRTGRAFALIRLGRAAEAEEELRAVRDASALTFGPDHNITLTSRHIRAIALCSMGRLAEAEAENRSILDTRTRRFGPHYASTLNSRENLASVLHGMGKADEAAQEAGSVLEIRTRVLGPDHPDTNRVRSLLTDIENEVNRSLQRKADR